MNPQLEREPSELGSSVGFHFSINSCGGRVVVFYVNAPRFVISVPWGSPNGLVGLARNHENIIGSWGKLLTGLSRFLHISQTYRIFPKLEIQWFGNYSFKDYWLIWNGLGYYVVMQLTIYLKNMWYIMKYYKRFTLILF